MGNIHHKALMICASVSAYTAPALMTVCLSTNYWIYGKQVRSSSTPILKAGDSRIFNYTYHRIGLWKECFKEKIDLPYKCDIVKYSKTEAKSEKGFKAVAYRSAPSMACFAAASALLMLAIFLFTRGLCKRRRKAVFFISGLLFSISGLLTMVGVTLYVSITTEESVKFDQNHPVMKPSYGYSFICAVGSFVLQELTGVLTVYWFIYRFRALVRKQEKLRERTRQLMGNCLSMTTALPLNVATIKPILPPSKSYSNHRSSNYNRYSSSNPQQRRRIPFDKSYENSYSSPMTNHHHVEHRFERFLPRSPPLIYGDYCRVLIRPEDMDLLTQMVKSKSQAQFATYSRPTSPSTTKTTTTTTKSVANSHHENKNHRKSMKKPVKRTTSV